MRAPSAAADLAEQLEPIKAELGDELARFCLDRVPELPQDDEAVELLRAGARGHMAHVTTLLANPDTETTVASQPEAAAAYAAMCARRGIDVGIVQRATRLGVDWFWRTLGERLAAAVEDRERRGELLEAGMEVVLGYADQAIGWIEPTYTEERRRWVRSPEAVRRATAQEVLAGGAPNIDEASRRLGYELRGDHRALILWRAGSSPPEDHDPAAGGATGAERNGARADAASAAAATAIADLADGGSALVVPDGEGLWAWIDADADLGRWSAPPQWRAAAGDPGSGVAGFRSSHEQARVIAHALRPLGATPGPLTTYEEAAVPALIGAQPERARELVRTELGPLAAGDERAARLRATLSAYHAAGCRYAGAAETLGIHENTVAYRLRQAAELLGRPLNTRRLELAVALRLLETFGAGWLDAEEPAPGAQPLA